MDLLWKDLKTALRTLPRQPAYAAASVAILALGMGVAAKVFSVLSGVLLDPLPFPEAERLTMLWNDNRNQGWPKDVTSYTNYLDWKSRNSVFQGVAAFRPRSYNLTGDGDPQRVRGAAVSASFFSVMGVPPLLGQVFGEEEEEFGADRSVLLSHGFWTRQFGAGPQALGRKMTLSGQVFEIVGVMPRQFQFPEDVELWTPLAPEQGLREARGALWLHAIGRLKPHLPLDAAQAEMSRIAAQTEEEHPDTNEGYGINVSPLLDDIVGEVRPGLLMLMTAVMRTASDPMAALPAVRSAARQLDPDLPVFNAPTVELTLSESMSQRRFHMTLLTLFSALALILAVSGLYGVVSDSASQRTREIGVPLALGARRGQILRLVLREGMALTLIGIALGLTAAVFLTRFMESLLFGVSPGDALTLAMMLALVCLAALGACALPAARASRVDPARALHYE